MRDYAKLVPTFWTGDTGKAIRKRGPEGVVVALYLMSSPTSNMLGLYYQPVLYMAHETGLGIGGASEGLRYCIEEGFCLYDEATEFVWVKEMASFQIGKGLKASDNRCVGIQREYDSLPVNPFLSQFFERYQGDFHLRNSRGNKAPSEPLSSQEQEQEQEQEHEKESSLRSESSPQLSLTGDPTPPPADPKVKRQERIRQIAEEAQAAFNAKLAKPNGELAKCTVLNKPRIKAVEKALPTAVQLCQQLFGDKRVTPKFWELYFETAADDDFHAGRQQGGAGHENWKPDFEYLLRENVIAKLADKALSEVAS